MREDQQECTGGVCNSGEVCRDITYAMGYCLEPHVRAKLVAGEPVLKGDWSKTWWRSGRDKEKGPAPRKEQAPKPHQKIKVKA